MSFGTFTALALAVDGFLGILHDITFNLVSIQIVADLVLALDAIDIWVHGMHGPAGTRGHGWLRPC